MRRDGGMWRCRAGGDLGGVWYAEQGFWSRNDTKVLSSDDTLPLSRLDALEKRVEKLEVLFNPKML